MQDRLWRISKQQAGDEGCEGESPPPEGVPAARLALPWRRELNVRSPSFCESPHLALSGRSEDLLGGRQ